MSSFRDWERSAPMYQSRRSVASTPTEKWLKRFREGFAILPAPLLEGLPTGLDNNVPDVSLVETSLQECLEDNEWTSYNVYGLLGAVCILQARHDKTWELSKKKLDMVERIFKASSASSAPYGELGQLLHVHTSLYQILVYTRMILS